MLSSTYCEFDGQYSHFYLSMVSSQNKYSVPGYIHALNQNIQGIFYEFRLLDSSWFFYEFTL